MNAPCFILTFLFASATAAETKPPTDYLISILEKARELELFSLDPSDDNAKNGFHGYKVLGKTLVKKGATVQTLVSAFKKGIQENKRFAAKCFIPRHGLRFKIDKVTVDLVICFQCLQVKQFTNDRPGPTFLISKSPQPTFDKVLKDAGVKLPKPAKK